MSLRPPDDDLCGPSIDFIDLTKHITDGFGSSQIVNSSQSIVTTLIWCSISHFLWLKQSKDLYLLYDMSRLLSPQLL